MVPDFSRLYFQGSSFKAVERSEKNKTCQDTSSGQKTETHVFKPSWRPVTSSDYHYKLYNYVPQEIVLWLAIPTIPGREYVWGLSQ